MCELVSWVELPNGEIKFVTGNQLFRTAKGKAITTEYSSCDDWAGHSVILKYHALQRVTGGCKQRECTDFRSPANFPPEIASAIRAGAYRGLISSSMLVMLTPAAKKIYADREKAGADWKKADADREKAYADRKKADADWKKADADREKAYADKVRADADWEKADADREKAYADREKAYADREKAYADRKKADADWEKADADWKKADADREKADADWKKADADHSVFWDLFANPENRNPVWR